MEEPKKDLTAVVRWPGALLVTAGVMNITSIVVSTLLVTFFKPRLVEWLKGVSPFFTEESIDPLSPMNLASSAFGLLVSLVAIAGGVQMMRLRSWILSLVASVIVMTPCFLCCGLFLPAGIWALVVLLRDDVKTAMRGAN